MKNIKKIDYRHVLCILITVTFLLLSVFVFSSSFGRLVEGGRDFGLSVGYYFCELFGIDNDIAPTVNDLPKVPFFDSDEPSSDDDIVVPAPDEPNDAPIVDDVPSTALPDTYDGFKSKWAEYWETFVSKNNVLGYLSCLESILYVVPLIVLYAVPLILLLHTVVKRSFDKTNNRYNFDTKPLSVAKRVAKITYLPAKKWIVEFCDFLKRNRVYYAVWAIIWAYNFNLITIVLEFLAFYFYFVVSFDFPSMYTQVYKLCLDLWTPFHYVPWCLWIILALCCFNRMRKAIAFNVLNHNEMKNRGFINDRPIVFMACGSMGKNKTTFITDVALSQEVMFRDKAFEKILENDLKFPYFPWINLENAIKTAMEYHQVYNLATVRAYVQKKYRRFQKSPKCENIFDYDYVRYGLTYNDNLVVADVWDVIETYAQLYFIYVIESSLLVSNYSVRVDGLLQDLGNFPLWNSDFFKSDSRLIDSYSRHAHILDFDALRLGRKMIENNPNRDNFEFGVVLITEVGKERGNSIELVEKKKNDKGTNQKNDLFNSWLKMVRHSATVDNFPFVRVICDEQRPESWGADARDLCEIVYIKECSAPKLAMPFFNLAEIIHDSIFGRFKHLYSDYRYRRGDNSLIMYAIKSVFAKAHSYYERIHNLFDYKVLSLQVESGTMDGQIKDCKYYLSSKKIYSKRFSTDCFSDYFTQKAMRSAVGIDDMFEYASEKATSDELSEQNSYFVTELLQGINKEK